MPESNKPTIVLVHGAWADASSWNAVSVPLQAQGYTVLAPPNELRGLTSDAAYIASFLAQRTTGPVVLVGHSYGGAVITNAGAQGGDVKALVYVDAFIPDEGETVVGILEGSSSALAVADPTTRPGCRRLPRRARGCGRGVPQARHRAQLLRPRSSRSRPLDHRRHAATGILRRECHARQPCRPGRASPAGPCWAPKTGSSRSTCSAGWPSAPERRSPKSMPPTCRWSRVRR